MPHRDTIKSRSDHEIYFVGKLEQLIEQYEEWGEDPIGAIDSYLSTSIYYDGEKTLYSMACTMVENDQITYLLSKIDWENESFEAQKVTSELREHLDQYHLGEFLSSLSYRLY